MPSFEYTSAATINASMATQHDTFFNLETFTPSLQQAFRASPLDLSKLIRVSVPVENSNQRPFAISKIERNKIFLTDGQNVCPWEVESLSSLFRGDKRPPVLGDIPQAYRDCLMLFEAHVLEISAVLGDRRDTEMKEIYSAIRRRPDGRSLGQAHDFMWQAAAFMVPTGWNAPAGRSNKAPLLGIMSKRCRGLLAQSDEEP